MEYYVLVFTYLIAPVLAMFAIIHWRHKKRTARKLSELGFLLNAILSKYGCPDSDVIYHTICKECLRYRLEMKAFMGSIDPSGLRDLALRSMKKNVRIKRLVHREFYRQLQELRAIPEKERSPKMWPQIEERRRDVSDFSLQINRQYRRLKIFKDQGRGILPSSHN